MLAVGGEVIAEILQGVCRETLDGRNEWLGDGDQHSLGREPRDFANFFRLPASAGAGNSAA